jgi:hypothetical protein
MKKKLLLGGMIISVLVLAGCTITDNQTSTTGGKKDVAPIFSDESNQPETTKSPTKQGVKDDERDMMREETKAETTNREATFAIKFPASSLSGKDEAGNLIAKDISIWKEAGDGLGNMVIGTVPDNTEVEVLESKTVEGFIFYHINSSVGKVSVLPTDFEARKRAMEERPESDWHVDADPSFVVEGWVSDSFITKLK